MDDLIICPECDAHFDVIWLNNEHGGPEFCPMCGVQIDYDLLG